MIFVFESDYLLFLPSLSESCRHNDRTKVRNREMDVSLSSRFFFFASSRESVCSVSLYS
jgi:hypothetical protein